MDLAMMTRLGRLAAGHRLAAIGIVLNAGSGHGCFRLGRLCRFVRGISQRRSRQ